MGRPKKIGLDYFSMDTNWDTAMRLLKAKFGLLGIGCMVELYKTIYQEGYYVSWDADAKLLFSVEHHIDIDTLDSIISEAILRGMFDSDMLKTYRILTSRGIQKRWKHIMDSLKRSVCDMDFKYDLLTQKQISAQEFDKNVVNPEDTPVSPEETPVNSGFSAQMKGKEMKGNDTIQKPTAQKRLEDFSHESKELANTLYDLHLKIDPGYKQPNLDIWATDIDNIYRIDGRDWPTIEAVIRWAKGDPFWRSNIISGKKLREKFPQLYAKMQGVDKPKKKQDNPWIDF